MNFLLILLSFFYLLEFLLILLKFFVYTTEFVADFIKYFGDLTEFLSVRTGHLTKGQVLVRKKFIFFFIPWGLNINIFNLF